MSSNLSKYFSCLAAGILYFTVHFFLRTNSFAIEFNPDEGSNLMKSLLTSKGFLLYRDIWSDQPPLLTNLLRYFMSIFGWKIEIARILILLFSSLIIIILYRMLEEFYGHFSAAAGVLLLAASSGFFWLSVSIMIGLPSVSLALTSICLMITWYKSKNLIYPVLSGITFGSSLSIKLFTLPLLSCIAAVLIYETIKSNQTTSVRITAILKTSAIWLISCFAVLIFVFYDFNMQDIYTQFSAHSKTALEKPAIYQTALQSLKIYFTENRLLTIMALPGLLQLYFRINILLLVMSVWFFVMLAVLALHFPVWPHQLILLSIPMSVFGAITLNHALTIIYKVYDKNIQNKNFKSISLVTAAAFIIFLFFMNTFYSYKRISSEQSGNFLLIPYNMDTQELLDNVEKYSRQNNFILTDRPVLAFYHGLLTPPWLAVISIKRGASNQLELGMFTDSIVKYNVGQIILSKRITTGLKNHILSYAKSNYTQIGEFSGFTHLVRNDLLDD